jgi:hypothetical protein
MNTVNIHLSDFQKNRIRSAYKKNKGLSIQLKNNQLKGKDKLMVTDTQKKQIDKSIRNNTGLRLNLNYNQLLENHSGGFLPLLFAGLGALGALIGGSSAIANTVINKKAKDKELEEQKRHNLSMEGKGLKKTKS